VLIEPYRRNYNTVRPHTSLRYRDPRRSGGTAIAGLGSASRPRLSGNGGGDDDALAIKPDHLIGAAPQAGRMTAPCKVKSSTQFRPLQYRGHHR
jgi:hypothetical protein